MRLPDPCGQLSSYAVSYLSGRSTSTPPPVAGGSSVITDRDAQLALWTAYEMSYRGFDDVDPGMERDLGLIELRASLEDRLEAELRAVLDERVAEAVGSGADVGDVGDLVLAVVQEDEGPHLSSYLRRDATAEQMRDYLRERSVQQLKESDPQAFLLPRLQGAAKVALAELQYDEFGAGRPEYLHQDMYARTLKAVGLDPAYGAYIDEVSAISLASANVMSLFALNRRLVGAGVGHFAAFEASSSVPSRKVAAGLDRLGLSAAAEYFEEHVEADAVHEQIAARDICGSVVRDDPGVLGEVVFGVMCCLHLDALSGAELLSRWGAMDDTGTRAEAS
jgi:pyrroloquinoline quinone (PQQ) biosynthesis protein C